MDPNLHQKQGINHLNRVLDYSQFVAEDWQVVADTLFAMNTPREMLPATILDYRLANSNATIELETEDCLIAVEPF